ncbi:DnaD domain-containing protein [Streptococcus ovuberis]|uniref:DnaD domain-containing protein n=1 Tax=Streptococcus ovuberis TaxID=1936207 RepID=A0A7X6S0H3_9STRE|nr:DnaD domain-containing protein [Streptococcus ovuberis]NKZ20119.1 DnaD domain-containing protein [Streptococcus ovuberis]
MSYSKHFKSGNVVLPAALLFHFKDLFSSRDDFLVWQFFFYQNTSQLEELAPSTIAQATGLTVAEVNQAISDLQSAGLLEFKTIELAGEIEMIFDALPALDKLDTLLADASDSSDTEPSFSNAAKALVADFERELGRFLSPFEIEDLEKSLQENVAPELIREALKEAVFNGKANWKYIQAILRNWRREGITTLAQVEARQAEREVQMQPQGLADLADYQAALGLFKD